MRAPELPILATAAVARLKQTDPTESRVALGCAGRTPATQRRSILTADGRVQTLTSDPDPLRGVDLMTARHGHEVVLDHGAVVLLDTPGLVERRGCDVDHGTARRQTDLADLAGQDLDHLCDKLLTGLLLTAPQDDIALVAVGLRLRN